MNPAPEDPSVLFSAEGLDYSIGRHEVLRHLTFRIRPGLTWVRGGEGRGKTSLLRLIAGLDPSSGGVLWRRGGPVYFESPGDEMHDPVVARAWLAARQARFPGWQCEVADALVQAFGLAEHVDKPMFMLSTGSRRKVGLVAAAACGAPLTLLDMPFAALDARSCRVLTELLEDAAAPADGLAQDAHRGARAWVVTGHELAEGIARAGLSGWLDLGD